LTDHKCIVQRRALSIRQPSAELILREGKTIEYRSRPTRIIGEPFYIYAARKWAGAPGNGHAAAPRKADLELGDAPTGVIVGVATIAKCERSNGHYEWHLSDVKRLAKPRKPKCVVQSILTRYAVTH
jgi:hypothetical protein